MLLSPSNTNDAERRKTVALASLESAAGQHSIPVRSHAVSTFVYYLCYLNLIPPAPTDPPAVILEVAVIALSFADDF